MDCFKCSSCCRFPGMFLPDEINIFLKSYSKDYIVLHLLSKKDMIFGLEPTKKKGSKIATYEYYMSFSKCKFLKWNKCTIHNNKPYGCRVLECTRMTKDEKIQNYNLLLNEWKKNQKIIYNLYPELKNIKNLESLQEFFNVKDISIKHK